jgi:hypothetical protein
MEVIVVGVILGGGLAVGLTWWEHHQKKERLAVWRQVALSRRGQLLEPSGGVFSRKPHRIEVDVGPARVLCDTYTDSSGSTAYTRVRAHFALPAGPVFKVYREGVLSSLGKAVGTQDVMLGTDPAFDRIFMVKCDEPATMRYLWTSQAQQIMVRNFQACRVTSDGQVVKLVGKGAWQDRRQLDQALDLVGDLAAADLFGLKALQAVPGASYEPPQGSWDVRTAPRAVVVIQATRVALGPAIAPGGCVVTMARARLSRRLPACQVELGARGEPQGAVPPGMLSADAAALLPGVGESVLRCEEQQATLSWPGVQWDPEALLAGARLLAGLGAAGQRGMYR